MAFEISSARWTQTHAGGALRGSAPAPLDWNGLRARLVAGRELRRVIKQAAPDRIGGGSFASEIAALLSAPGEASGDASGKPSPGVNPNDLGNRKVAARMDGNDGGTLVPADRGTQ